MKEKEMDRLDDIAMRKSILATQELIIHIESRVETLEAKLIDLDERMEHFKEKLLNLTNKGLTYG